MSEQLISTQKNVLGGPLLACSYAPLTGFFRTGGCETSAEDLGRHVICVRVTEGFLAFSRARGNDLSTPRPEMRFAGLRAGDRWCLCAARFLQAVEEGCAPRVDLTATHRRALDIVPLEVLHDHSVDATGG